MENVIELQIEELESMEAPGWGEIAAGFYTGASIAATAVSIGIVFT